MVSGTILDSATGSPMPQSLELTIEGPARDLVIDTNGVPATTFTIADGNVVFWLASDAAPSVNAPVRITLVVRGDGLVPTSLPLTITASATEFLLRATRMIAPPPGVATGQGQGEVDPVTGMVMSPVVLQTTEPITNVTAKVALLAGTVITDSAGVRLSGTLTMKSAYFSPSVASSLAAFPGGFSVETTRSDGTSSPGEFITAGLMSVQIADQYGRQAKNFSGDGLQLAVGISMNAINPITSRPIEPGDRIGIFSNDTATGQWSEEGVVTVAASGDQRVAVFYAKHLSLWNLDFKVDRCHSAGFFSRRIIVEDLYGRSVCSPKMRALRIALSLQGGPVPVGYLRVLTPFDTVPGTMDANVLQFRNAPLVTAAS
jgi:hypothetical protein